MQLVTFLPIRKEVAVWKKPQLVTFLPIRKEVAIWKKTQFVTFLPIRKEVPVWKKTQIPVFTLGCMIAIWIYRIYPPLSDPLWIAINMLRFIMILQKEIVYRFLSFPDSTVRILK